MKVKSTEELNPLSNSKGHIGGSPEFLLQLKQDELLQEPTPTQMLFRSADSTGRFSPTVGGKHRSRTF